MGEWALMERMADSADAVLRRQGHVSAVDALIQARLLDPADVVDWRRSNAAVLEDRVQGPPERRDAAVRFFHAWAQASGLTREDPPIGRRFAADATRDALYRIRYFRADVTAPRRRTIAATDRGPARAIVVIDNTYVAACAECGSEIAKHARLRMEGESTLCLRCADLAHLVFLPAGDAARTRAAKRSSRLWAAVVRFDRATRRYVRTGMLVEGGQPGDRPALYYELLMSGADRKEARRRVESAC